MANITHLLVIPSSFPQLLCQERCTAVIQIVETYCINNYGTGMLHVISSTNTNITYTLGYFFLQSVTEADLTWILKTSVEQGILINPRVKITDADQALMNSIYTVFPQANHQLCLWHIQSNIKARHQRDFLPSTWSGAVSGRFRFLKNW